MGVVDPQRIFLRGDIVSQHQVQLIFPLPHPGDRGDGVVGLAVRLSEDESVLVRIAPPGGEDLVRQLHQPAVIFAPQTEDAHRPFDDARLHIGESGKAHQLFHRGLLHGESVVPALEMVVAEDGAAHDGQVRIRAHEVVGELLDEIQKLPESAPVDLHGRVEAVENDAVLIVVHIRGVLEEPVRPGDGHGDDPVVLPGGMVHAAGVALVLPAELTLGIAALRGALGGGDGLGVLLRLGEVDGDVQVAVFCPRHPFDVFRNAVAANIAGVLTEGVVPVRSGPGALGIALLEAGDDLTGPGGKHAHELGVQQVPAGDIPLDEPPLDREVHQTGEGVLQSQVQRLLRLGELLEVQDLQKAVDSPDPVRGFDKPGLHSVVGQSGHMGREIGVDHNCSLLTPGARRPQDGWSAHDRPHRPDSAPSPP